MGFSGTSSAQTYVFTSGTSFTPPIGAKAIDCFCIGGGGGGGSGACEPTTTARSGGGGGAGGAISFAKIGGTIPTTIGYVVGAAGNGGASVSATSSGNSGTAGGTSNISIAGTLIARASGGGPGGGGTMEPSARARSSGNDDAAAFKPAHIIAIDLQSVHARGRDVLFRSKDFVEAELLSHHASDRIADFE